MRYLSAALNFILVGFFMISVSHAASYSSRVVGMKFAEVPFPDDFRMSVMNVTKQPGGEVVVLVRSPVKKIIAIDKDKTANSLMSWKIDSHNKKIMIEKDLVKPGYFSNISKDAFAVLVTFKYRLLPDVSVNSIHTKGNIFLQTAISKVDVSKKGFQLKAGNVLKLGPVQMTFVKSGKPQWGKEPLKISFDVSGNLSQLADIQFFHVNGKKIKSSRGGTMTMSMGGFKKVSVDYHLAEKVSQVLIKAKYWKGLEVVKVPLVIKVNRIF